MTSPDVDRLWAPDQGGLHHWRNHRGWPHRVWFASLLTLGGVLLCAVLPPVLWLVPGTLLWGWWSHLTGDMIYGKIKILGRLVGLGLRVGDYATVRVLWVTVRVPAEKAFRRAVWVLPAAAWVLVAVVEIRAVLV